MSVEKKVEQLEQLKQILKSNLKTVKQIEQYFNEIYLNKLNEIRTKYTLTPEAIINCDFYTDSGLYCFNYETSLNEIENIYYKYVICKSLKMKFINLFKLIVILNSIN